MTSTMVLILLAGLFIGLMLGLAGGGGSVVTVPLLVYVVHLPPKIAIVTSMVIVGITSLVSLVSHARANNVAWRAGSAFGLTGMVGAYVGSLVAHLIADGLLLLIFAVVMLFSGLVMLRRARTEPAASAIEVSNHVAPPSQHSVRLITDGFLVGVVTGLVGVGGGFLVVPALTLLRGLPMHTAIGTSLLIIAMNCTSGVISHRIIAGVPIDTHAAIIISMCTVCGTVVGTHLCKSISALNLRRGFAYFVLLVAVCLIAIEGSRQLAPILEISRLQAGVLLSGICGLAAARLFISPLSRNVHSQ